MQKYKFLCMLSCVPSYILSEYMLEHTRSWCLLIQLFSPVRGGRSFDLVQLCCRTILILPVNLTVSDFPSDCHEASCFTVICKGPAQHCSYVCCE